MYWGRREKQEVFPAGPKDGFTPARTIHTRSGPLLTLATCAPPRIVLRFAIAWTARRNGFTAVRKMNTRPNRRPNDAPIPPSSAPIEIES